MGFSQATMTSIAPPQFQGGLMYLSWTSTSPTGTWFQVYIDQQLSWWGKSLSARLPVPNVSPLHLDIGTVLAGEEQTDFSSSLPSSPQRFAELNWIGGSFEAPDIAGFYVYGSAVAGGPVVTSSPLATITTYPGGFSMDGFGLGGFGLGGFGYSSSAYSWLSGPLTAGVWNFQVTPFDVSGNSGTPTSTSITIVAPPLPPALDPLGLRLQYTYDASTFEVTLNWLASPTLF